ncbi:MAG: DUF2785 domain-containing protein [Actinomycetes bacterium]
MSNVATWERAVRDGCAVPADTCLAEAAADLTVLLGSPDQHSRDEIAYALLSTWIARGTFDDLLLGLGDGMCAGLRSGLGEAGTDSVFRRSFSALVLVSVVERDTAVRVLHPASVMSWADSALHWFLTERDLRAHTGAKGWAHAVAHGADLVAALGMSRHLGADELGVLLDAIAERLSRSAPSHLTHAEDDRLAYATMAILHRDLLDVARLDAWVARLVRPFELDLAGPHAAAHMNTRDFLRALHLMLRFGVAGGMPWHRRTEYFAQEPGIRIEVLRAVEEALRGYHPGLYSPPPAPAEHAQTGSATGRDDDG